MQLEEWKSCSVEASKDLTTYKIQNQAIEPIDWVYIQFASVGIGGFASLSVGRQSSHEWLEFPFHRGPEAMAFTIAAVAMAARTFLDRYPRRRIIIAGTSPARNRLHRMILNSYKDLFTSNFSLAALIEPEPKTVRLVHFQPDLKPLALVIGKRSDFRPP